MVVNNPNNWHWVDKNCISWARQYFSDNLISLKGTSKESDVTISSVVSVEGDVVVSQRKGKVISLFDLKLVLRYEGSLRGVEAQGTITVPEVAYDTEEDEYQFDVSVFNESKDNTDIKGTVRNALIPQLRKTLKKFGSDLLATHSGDIQVDENQVSSKLTKENQSSLKVEAASVPKTITATSSTKINTSSKSASAPVSVSASASSSIPKYNTSTLHFEPTFNATAEQLYLTFLDKTRLCHWTRSSPDFDGQVLSAGKDFSLFGGNIKGRVVALEPNARIEQLWRLESWKAGHFAKLNIAFYQGEGETKLDVLFDGIPIGEEELVQGNFEERYIRSIKITFGFGAVL